MRHIISLLVENKPGVVSRVSGLFSGRGYSLESITYGETMDPSLCRVTLTSTGDETAIEQILKQLHRLIDTIKVQNLTDHKAITRELAIVKVRADKGYRAEIIKMAETYKATVLDVSTDSFVMEITGSTRKIEDFIEVMSEYTILDIARSGLVALEKGSKTTKGKKS
ncbi:acetolactate synthase small subunit [Spirochaeta cellobiosiphila]|uniref:acetolactate synthase small subunit n=1 Tax=Spirochaeta cellobiosiphila TaxID=504483 RepID=UPI0003FAAB83|nr:acetolactate synthase small subunit [Spirochaeta cellobiosiphila]